MVPYLEQIAFASRTLCNLGLIGLLKYRVGNTKVDIVELGLVRFLLLAWPKATKRLIEI